MLNLSEYRGKADRLADHLPWAALVAPGTVLNKDGSFQRTLRFRGPDLESATEAELIGICARANNALRRLGSGWALFFEAERIEALGYPNSRFPDAASWLVDEERRAAFEGKVEHFESRYHLTFLFMPPGDAQARAESALVDSHHSEGERDWHQELARFRDETDRALDLLSGFMPEVRVLDDAETLTYLHGTISPRRHPVAVPETPMYLDAILVDAPLIGGLEPMLGEQHLRTLTILGFPNATRPGILDALNNQDFAYRWMTRFIPLDKTEATKTLTRLRRQWFAKRKSIVAILREVVTNEPVPLVDSDADNKALDADDALQALGGDHVGFGYLTTTVTVWDEDRQAAAEKLRAVERIINGLGFTTIREGINAVEAWLGSLPGHVYANVRQPLIHTLNLAHLMPLSSVWAGPATNEHLAKVTQTEAPPLLVAETSGSTPFRLSTHVEDVGHMLIVGPTGAGKSVLLALFALQFRRYAGAQVYVFDKGNSARAATLAMGGEHHALGADGALSFQPLRDIDDQANRSWAAEWIASLIAHENVAVTPEVKEAIWSSLASLATAPAQERTLTGLSVLLQSNALKSALMPYTLEGPFGRLLDADDDRLNNFKSLADIIYRSFAGLGINASSGNVSADNLLHPGRIAATGFQGAWPLLDQASQLLGFPEIFGNALTIFVLLVAWFLVIIAFFILSIQLFITILEFKLTTLAGFTLVPFALWNRSAFLAERVLGNVISSGIKVMVLAVIVGIGSTLFGEFASALQGKEPDLAAAMSQVLGALALLGLGIFGPGIASGLVSGAPQLGAGAALGTTAAAAGASLVAGGAAFAGARMATGGGLAAVRAGTTMGSAASAAWQLGRATSADSGLSGVAAGVQGVAGAARGAGMRAARSAAGAFGRDVDAGRKAAWTATGGTPTASMTGSPAGPAADAAPTWARRLRSEQTARAHRHAAVQAVRDGDRSGGSANRSLNDKDD